MTFPTCEVQQRAEFRMAIDEAVRRVASAMMRRENRADAASEARGVIAAIDRAAASCVNQRPPDECEVGAFAADLGNHYVDRALGRVATILADAGRGRGPGIATARSMIERYLSWAG